MIKEILGKIICFFLTVVEFFVKRIFKNGKKYQMFKSDRDMK
mgnify:CR=1 FL=1|tara:strand:+ start:324 stop:449 length:126 start_codon:yes stop_codon:yes gene_type:complete